ncbi:hypothetical protein FRC01_005863 [Tulasnella sp. 417]|nr:hypothetical protein FRC01_005863 [Tulasnella sp. 417]
MSHVNASQAQATLDDDGALVAASGSFSSPIQIIELIEEIMSYLLEPDLLSAARVCKTWSEPALNRLWRNLFSLVPLLSLIAPVQSHNDEDMDFIHDIDGADWSRYAFYVHRIRNIDLSDFPQQRPMSVRAVKKYADSIPPHLATALVTSLSTFSVSPTPLPLHVVPFISQSLRELCLIFSFLVESTHHSSSVCVRSMVAAVSAAAALPNPSLQYFKLSGHAAGTDLCTAITECLAKHQSTIYKLALDVPIDHQVWRSICNLPFVREVGVTPFSRSELGNSARIIPMLDELVKAKPLLERLRVSLPAAGFGPVEEPDLYRRIIRQLLGLHSLRSVGIYASAPISLSENDVREMGASWPQIRTVRLQAHIAWFTPGQMAETDLCILPHFLRHFPYLEELDLPLRCDNLPRAEQPTTKLLLGVLEVSGSPAPKVDTEQVAAYLASALPPSTRIKGSFILSGGEAKARWEEIIRRYDTIRKADRQSATSALPT